MNYVHGVLFCLAALAIGILVVPTFAHAKEKAPRASSKAAKQHASVFDRDGYRLVSPNSTMRCAQTLRGTLDCKE